MSLFRKSKNTGGKDADFKMDFKFLNDIEIDKVFQILQQGEDPKQDKKALTEKRDINESKNAAISFLQKLLPQMLPVNFVISPLSIKFALMMIANGSDQRTKDEILGTLGATDIEKLNMSLKESLKSLSVRGVSSGVVNNEVCISNSIWLNCDKFDNPDVDFAEGYKEKTADCFDGECMKTDSETMTECVNEKISEKTKGAIKSVLASDNAPALAVVNVLYMKSKWRCEFDARDTYIDWFFNIRGEKTQKEFMHIENNGDFGYYKSPFGNTKILQMPYLIAGLSMCIVLGDADNFENEYDKIKTNCGTIRASIPKFTIEFEEKCREMLQGIGIRRAFEFDNKINAVMLENADKAVKIDDVFHKAVIEVGEAETTAAAVTIAEEETTAAAIEEKPAIDFKADEPFTFFVTDILTREILFAGRYVE